MIGVASRHTPTTPTTSPSWMSGRYSRMVVRGAEVARSGLALGGGRPARRRSGRPGPSASRPSRVPRNPATGASLARTVPSGRRISARMMPRGVTNDLQPGLEDGQALRRDPRRGQVGRRQEVVDEAADDLGVGADRLVERGRRDVDRGEHDLRGRRHAHDHEEHAVHDEQQERARRVAQAAATAGSTGGPPASSARLPIAVGTSRAPRSAGMSRRERTRA